MLRRPGYRRCPIVEPQEKGDVLPVRENGGPGESAHYPAGAPGIYGDDCSPGFRPVRFRQESSGGFMRYPTPVSVMIYSGRDGSASSFLRSWFIYTRT